MPVTRSKCGDSKVGKTERLQPTKDPCPKEETLPGPAREHKPGGFEVSPSTRTKSIRTTKSNQKVIAEAREKIARARLEEARAATALAEAEMARIAESSDDDETKSEHAIDKASQVKDWLENQPAALPAGTQPQSLDVQTLAEALMQAARPDTYRPKPPKFIQELPFFNGTSGEWLTFKSSYRDTKGYFTKIENLMRLKRSLRGTAKEAAQSLFIAELDPEQVMQHLEVRFGRVDALVLTEIEKMKGLAKLTDNPRDVCVFASRVSNIVAVVKSIKKVHYLHSPETVKAVVDKMTPTLRYRWYDYAASGKEDEPDLLKLSSFLDREAELCCHYAPAEVPKERDRSPAPKKTQRTYAAASESSTTQKPKRQATPPQADTIEAIESVSDRWAEAKKLKLCYRCLHKRGFRHRCAYRPCGTGDCKGSHHPLLHSERPTEPEVTAVAVEERGEEVDNPEVVTTTRPHMLERAYLKVIPICIKGPTGAVDTYALLDEGSTVTLVEEQVAHAVGAIGPKEPFLIEGIAGAQINASTSRRVSLHITGRHSSKEHEVRARTINRLHLSPQTIDERIVKQCQHLQEIAKDLIYENGTPTLLIGQDNWHIIVSKAVKSGAQGHPAASLTELGWVLHGSCETRAQHVHRVNKLEVKTDDKMEELMKSFFDLDNIGIEPRRPQNDQNMRALAILEERSRRLPDGRFETGLLWRNESMVLPNNRETAVRRLYSIERKLDKSPALKEQYHKQMAHLLESGYAEEATEPPQPGRTWYLPHFAVINPSKPKPRIVLDAAARTHGICLNDCLLTGPDLLQSLPGVLMRFRQREIAVTADIQEMFLRISIRKEDRDALRFLWRREEHRREVPPTEYRMRSVIFGAASSPCTAIFIKNKNAEEHRAMYPEAAEAIAKNHYMDDYCHSFDTLEEAVRISSNVNHVHQQAKFYLQKWASNKPEVIKAVAPEQVKQNEVELNDSQTHEKTLGLVWKPHDDVLGFNLNLKRVSAEVLNGTTKPTKREALRTIMSLFDPLGLVTPVIMPAKRLLQATWRLGVGWDDELPNELQAEWLEWLGHVQRLQHLSIARCYPRYASATYREMHIFVDASSTACVAAVYWRVVTECTTVHLSLVMAKGKVAPLKTTSIPRLELQAAVLGCRLARTVEREHDLQPARRVFWTDSRTVLAWLRTGPRAYKPFVAHRLAEVEEETKIGEWRWVPTALNVADDATRGTPIGFGHDHRWFRGPDFLYHPEESWPREPKPNPETTTGEERVATTRGQVRIIDALPEAARFSSWLRLVRATARVLQFIDLCRTRHATATGRIKRTCQDNDDPDWRGAAPSSRPPVPRPRAKPPGSTVCHITLEAHHVKAAERLWWRTVQEESFGDDLRRLRQHLPSTKDSPLRELSVFEDREGVLRLKSRIDAAMELPEERRQPPVLHGDHAYTRLYITWVHRKNHHAGTETVVNEIRSHLWVLRLRPTTRTIVRSCVTCRKLRARPATPATGDHPITRLAHHQRPFTYVGLDYFGPYTVTVGRKHEKRYVALFTCLTTRAVHLEVAGSLSTDSAIMALRRMMARRGCPTEIHSDNGTNLRGADAELQKAALQATKDEASIHAVTWRYIPPGAPFMGGAWERMVQCIKRALAATLNERHPSEEVLTTLLLEAEYTVNNRPLTPVSTSPDDLEALTPLHFILGGPARVPLPGSFTDRDLMAKQRWRHSQRLADIFWARWIKEYAPLLQHRREPCSQGIPPQVGDIVLLVDETMPRNSWIKGRVTGVHPGRDGVVRVVDVMTKTGLRRRATKKIVVLTK